MTATDLDITTTGGVVRGVALDGVHTWRGIPFAAPPVGDGRFRAPRPAEPWSGVRDASCFGPLPPQRRLPFELAGAGRRTPLSEDALTLNVTVPAAPADRPRPVMVFVHGGAFTSGGSGLAAYGGHALVRAGDVVYVSVNYRLGALGFLDLTSYATPRRRVEANLGLRDQVAALEWVRDNIAAFGGDPGAVTVFGESAGGTSVTTLLAVPAARGLFHRVIAQSPAPEIVYGPRRTAGWAREFVGLLGVEPGDRDGALAALLGADPETLVAAATRLDEWNQQATPGTLPFCPVVDGDLLPVHPADAFAAGTTHDVPLIIGTNRDEGVLFARTGTLLPTSPERVDRMFALADPPAKARVVAAYPGYPGRAAATEVGGDVTFWWPSVRSAEGHSRVAPTFMYRFDHAPRAVRLAGVGATHGAELLYVFGAVDSPFARAQTALGGRAELRAVSRRMQEHWVHFARHGVPCADWPGYDADARRTLVVDADDRVEADPWARRRVAWTGYRNHR